MIIRFQQPETMKAKYYDDTIRRFGIQATLHAVEQNRNDVITALSMLNRAFNPLKLNLQSYSNIHMLMIERKKLSPIEVKKRCYDIIYGIEIDSYSPGSQATTDFQVSMTSLLKPLGTGFIIAS